jgi:xanthine dehydrogenase YagS FAD-binding subunit
MKAFAYVTAQTADSAVELVRDRGRFLAGGMDLLGEMKDGLVEPAVLVNVKALPGTREIAATKDRIVIGANVTLAALAAHAEVKRVLPGLAQAADDAGSPQMRNVATVGGNLAQHSRCWYYRSRDVRCVKKGGARCFARGGENKYHSLFTKNMCLSPCVSNLAVALASLDAAVVVQRGAKPVTLTIAQLYEQAWSDAKSHNSLGADDLILRIEVPVVAGARSVYAKISEKSEFDWALVSCAAAGRVEGGRLRGVRIALGSVAATPGQMKEANAFLEGKPPTDETAAGAAEILLRGAEPREQNGYKIPIAKALVKRALAGLAA